MANAHNPRADRFSRCGHAGPVRQRVAVIGGGNTAMDGRRTALRLGPEKAYCFYRRTRTEAPARVEEIEHAIQEGVDLWLTAPTRYIGNEDYFVKQIEIQRMELGDLMRRTASSSTNQGIRRDIRGRYCHPRIGSASTR